MREICLRRIEFTQRTEGDPKGSGAGPHLREQANAVLPFPKRARLAPETFFESNRFMQKVYLAAAVRTPIGRFGGTLASWSAADLGVAVAKESLRRANIQPRQVEDSIWGCARQAGGGPNVARQITFRAGVPETVPAFTVNQACGSGLKAIILGAQEIMLGRADAVLAGGTESMSRVPYFAEGARWGMRMGNLQLVDGMYRDGFNDPLSGLMMGQTAEKLARQYEISRDEQDQFALRSQQKAEAAIKLGRFKDEIT